MPFSHDTFVCFADAVPVLQPVNQAAPKAPADADAMDVSMSTVNGDDGGAAHACQDEDMEDGGFPSPSFPHLQPPTPPGPPKLRKHASYCIPTTEHSIW